MCTFIVRLCYCVLRILMQPSVNMCTYIRVHTHTHIYIYVYIYIYTHIHTHTGWSKSLCAPDDYTIRTILTQFMTWRWPSQNTFGMRTVLYWTRSLRTQFDVSINVWRLAGDTFNITCNFLYCNHQVHRDFLITLCVCVCVCVKGCQVINNADRQYSSSSICW